MIKRWCYAMVVLCAMFLLHDGTDGFAGSVTYIYDKAGRLTKAKYDNGKVIEYTYDNAGNLLEKKMSDSVPTCEVSSLELSASKLKLKKGGEDKVTVTVTGKDDCVAEGEVVDTQLNTGAEKIISVFPTEQVTDKNGGALFTITAEDKTGSGKIKFECGGKSKTLKVKVGK